MLRRARTVKINKDADLGEAVSDVIADGTPRLLVRDGTPVAVVITPNDYAELAEERISDAWQGYDPEKARQALRAAAGAITGVDREKLLHDLREERGQESMGRPG